MLLWRYLINLGDVFDLDRLGSIAGHWARVERIEAAARQTTERGAFLERVLGIAGSVAAMFGREEPPPGNPLGVRLQAAAAKGT
jgi:hypothetical protein